MRTIITRQKDSRYWLLLGLALLIALALIGGIFSCRSGQKDSVFSRKVGAPLPTGAKDAVIVQRSIPIRPIFTTTVDIALSVTKNVPSPNPNYT